MENPAMKGQKAIRIICWLAPVVVMEQVPCDVKLVV